MGAAGRSLNLPAGGAHMNLGIYAKSAAGPKNNDLGQNFLQTGAVLSLDDHRRRSESRDRWANQRAAGGLLQAERVAQCQRSLTRLGVTVERIADSGRTEFNGVLTCDSRWHCPICAAKITEGDRVELQQAMVCWKQRGGAHYLLTFTFPHSLALQLTEGVDKMQDAQRRLKGTRAYKAIMDAAGAVGAVKALEVTYGANGWHPHVHMIVFANAGAEAVLEGVRDLWAAAVEKVGLGRVNEHGFDLRGGDFAADYVAKFGKEPSDTTRAAAGAWWTAAHELTKGHTKQTQRLKGATPFTLLRWYREGDSQAGALFVEYAHAFKGRAQLYWSPGLRKKIDLLELQQPEKPAPVRVKVAHLSRDDWHAVLTHNARWDVLHIAERQGGDAVAAFVAELRRRGRGKWQGDFKMYDDVHGHYLGWASHAPAAHAERDAWLRDYERAAA